METDSKETRKENVQEDGDSVTSGGQSKDEEREGAPLASASDPTQAALCSNVSCFNLLYKEMIENHLNCSVCQGLVVEGQILDCSHMFCKTCIDQWMESSAQCPFCRHVILTKAPVLAVDNLVSSYFELQPDEVRSQRLAVTLDRNEALPRFGDLEWPLYQDNLQELPSLQDGDDSDGFDTDDEDSGEFEQEDGEDGDN